jgi:phosphogluconate dehydratase
LRWRPAAQRSGDEQVLRPIERPFSADGGLRLLQGNLGRAVVKVSAIAPAHRRVRAQALVFTDQKQLEQAFRAGQLERDFVAVVRNQGPRANGMPELHKLTPILSLLQDKGHAVALVTDGRMSGASGKVPAAIHVCPEAVSGGAIARVREGDWVTLDCDQQQLWLEVDAEELASRAPEVPDLSAHQRGSGRDLFALFRDNVGDAETGASPLLSLF